MKTIAFIGTCKNSGKTTSFNFVYNNTTDKNVIATSIGINGEDSCSYDGINKPTIMVKRDSYFLTTTKWLKNHSGKYQTVEYITGLEFSEPLILGKCLSPFNLILEGPNSKKQILIIKKILDKALPNSTLLIDGSIDRQFLADPKITDEFYFSLLLTKRTAQQNKMRTLLAPLSFSKCSDSDRDIILHNSNSSTKSIIILNNKTIYIGEEIPSLDSQLIDQISRNSGATIYINGAYTKTLDSVIGNNDKVIINNFTQFGVTSLTETNPIKIDNISLLTPANVKKIFIVEDGGKVPTNIPKTIPIHNLYREEINEIRI